MYSDDIRFGNGVLPYQSHQTASLVIAKASYHVFNELDILQAIQFRMSP